MKKQVKKLKLAKETMRNLTTHELRGAAGGASEEGCFTRGCNFEQWFAVSTSYYSVCTR